MKWQMLSLQTFRKMQILRLNLFALLFLFFASACTTTSNNKTTGIASWYGGKYNGRQTASGEIYDEKKMTAAHRTLPFGTIVDVTNVDNGKKVRVRINDRGPFIDGRIIDLSKSAFSKIASANQGLANVKIKVVK